MQQHRTIQSVVWFRSSQDQVTVTTQCPDCREVQGFIVKIRDLVSWDRSQKDAVQQFPYLTSGQQEGLMTGHCPKCWAEKFGEEPVEAATS